MQIKKCKKCGKKLRCDNTTGYCQDCLKLGVYKCVEPNCNEIVRQENGRCRSHAQVLRFSDPKEREKESEAHSGIKCYNYKHGNNCKGKIHYCIELDCNEIVKGPDRRCQSCEGKRRKIIHYCIEPICHEIVSRKGNRCIKCGHKITGLKRRQLKKPKPIYHCIEPNCNKEVSEPDRRCHKCAGLKRRKPKQPKPIYHCIEPNCNEKVSGPDRQCYSCASKKRWENIDCRNKMVKNLMEFCAIKPNKKEILLDNLLQIILPKEYKYVGNFKFFIEGKNPDFININGQKKIIEHFGDYWHANPNQYKVNDIVFRNLKASQIWEEDKKRLKTYKKYGYKTLIIWQHELKDIKKVEEKILQFNSEK